MGGRESRTGGAGEGVKYYFFITKKKGEGVPERDGRRKTKEKFLILTKRWWVGVMEIRARGRFYPRNKMRENIFVLLLCENVQK